MPHALLVNGSLAARRALAVFYRGDRYECPCCGRSFRALLPVGTTGRRAGCPRCGSRERHRLLHLFLQQRTNLLAGSGVVLHVAPEDWLQRKLREVPGLVYESIDLLSRAAMRRMSLTSLDYPGKSFDVVLCNHVLEHIPEDRVAMREVFRVLRPGGWAALQTPVDWSMAGTDEDFSLSPSERATRYGQADHVRMYGRDYVDRLRSTGFAVYVISAEECVSVRSMERFAIDPRDTLIIARRPGPAPAIRLDISDGPVGDAP